MDEGTSEESDDESDDHGTDKGHGDGKKPPKVQTHDLPELEDADQPSKSISKIMNSFKKTCEKLAGMVKSLEKIEEKDGIQTKLLDCFDGAGIYILDYGWMYCT